MFLPMRLSIVSLGNKFGFSFIQFRSISGEEISLFILSGKYIAIALVDHYKLRYVLYPQCLTNPIPVNFLYPANAAAAFFLFYAVRLG